MLTHPRAVAWLRNTLILSLALAAVWVVGAGAAGYRLGNPPSTCDAHTLLVDFVIPMWRADSDCTTITTTSVNP